MKKLLIIMVLALASFQLFAENEMIIQGMILNTSRVTEGTYKFERSFTSAGINFTSFSNSFSDLGFYSNVSFLMPISFEKKIDGTANTIPALKEYDMMVIDLDMLVGPGYNLDLGAMDLLLGGGLHFNGVAMMSNSLAIGPYLSYVLGAGGAGTVKFKITESFSFTASILCAYDFYEIYRIPKLAADYKTAGNLTYGAGVGLGFKY